MVSLISPLVPDVILVASALLGAMAISKEIRRRGCLAFARFSHRHPHGSIVAIPALIVLVRLSCLPVLPPPTPTVPDEQSNLLLAQTLASGRLANPPHPMWRHFETLFVLQQPSYASVYPPLQGVFLAAGWISTRQPWAGVLASIGFMLIATIWMLRAYVSPSWALYGGLLAGVGYGILTYWTNSYWGGAGAAIGGALVFGALPRMLSRGLRRDAALLGLGLLVLVNSRPYEGFWVGIAVGARVLWSFIHRRNERRVLVGTLAPVLAAVLAAGAALSCIYNLRVTGSPFRLPHMAYIQQYAVTPAFIWQRPVGMPVYRDRVLRDAHLSFGIDYAEYSTWLGAAGKSFRKLSRLATFYWGPFWVLALLALPECLRNPRYLVLNWSLALCTAGILLTVGFQVHYAAPCTAIFVLVAVDACRRLCKHLPDFGTALLVALPIAWLVSQAWTLKAAPHANSLMSRKSVEAIIANSPGRHLVLVHYGPSHALGEEWVYNAPDINNSRIIWARDLGPQINRELTDYFADRSLWLLEPDEKNPKITHCVSECPIATSDGTAYTSQRKR